MKQGMNNKATKAKSKNKKKTNNKNINKTTMLQEKEKTIVRAVKRQHPFMQILRVCRKEPLQCSGSNLTVSFQAAKP
jgi:hypothetical protein